MNEENPFFTQEIYQLEIQNINNKYFIDRKYSKGKSIVGNNDFTISETECSFSEFNNTVLKEGKIREIIKNVRLEYPNYPEIMLYYKLRYEKVWFSQEEDERYYEFFRIVYRDLKGNILIEEIIIDDKIDIYYSIIESMKKIVNVLNNFIRNNILKEDFCGQYDILIPTSLSGLFIHEVIGHLLEDDLYNYPDIIINNETRCSKILNVSDIPLANMNVNKIDDMGNPCKNIQIIKDGKIVNFLSDRTGNKRRQDFNHEAITRMRTTCIHSYSPKSANDFARSIKRGIYLENILTGSVSPLTGNYFLNGYGFFIENGLKKSFIPNLRIEGNVIEDLNKINDIGHDVELRGVECFKKNQSVRVASLSPSMHLINIKVGGDVYV